MASAAPILQRMGLGALMSLQIQILLLFPAKSALVSPLRQQRNLSYVLAHSKPASSLQITSSISFSKEGVRSKGCSNSHGGVVFISCYSLHPLYLLFWTHAFSIQAHARHPRADNLPRQAVNTSHLMLPPRIMCFPMSPAM